MKFQMNATNFLTKIVGAQLILCCFSLHAQVRTNRFRLEFEEKSIKLESAIGWKYNESIGRWISNMNLISELEVSRDAYSISKSDQNFLWIQFSKITYNNQPYFILLFECYDGLYKYPSIYRGWEFFKSTRFFIITSKDFSLLKNTVLEKKGRDVKFSSGYNGLVNNKMVNLGPQFSYTEENLLSRISESFDYGKPVAKESFVINSQVLNDKDIVRFTLPSMFQNKSNTLKSYFEVPLIEFQNILTFNLN